MDASLTGVFESRMRLSLAPRPADAGRVWSVIPLGGFVFGLVFGRWWTLLAVMPLASWILATNGLAGNVGTWVAMVLSALLACAIGAGVALRRLHGRRAV